LWKKDADFFQQPGASPPPSGKGAAGADFPGAYRASRREEALIFKEITAYFPQS